MSHLPTCTPCQEAPECNNPNTRYSLQDDVFFFVGSGRGGGGGDVLYLQCCDGVLMRQDFPVGVSANERAILIQDLVGRCVRKEPFCVGVPPSVDCPNPPCDTTPLTNNPQTCTANCPGGDVFSYTVPAGTFVGTDQELLDRLAHELACQQAQSFIICLADWQACICQDIGLTQKIPITSNNPPFSVSVASGVMPQGMRAVTQGNFVIVTGIPVVSGTYVFTLRVVDTFGNRAAKTYSIIVLEITTTSLPNYTLGTPYSFQLEADGGSGNYAWRVSSGTLPTGLTLSIGGLISGIPTADGSPTITFDVIDTTCETISRSFMPPRVSLSTRSETILRIKRGYPEYTLSSGTLYKTVTWSGSITQTGTVAATAVFIDEISDDLPPLGIGEHCGGAKYEYFGSTEIDIYGRITQNHNKDLYVECLRPVYPQLGGFVGEILSVNPVTRFYGYCSESDPNSCGICSDNASNWILDGNKQTPNPIDPPTQMMMDPEGVFRGITTYDYQGSMFRRFNFVTGAGGITAIDMTAIGEFGAVLSDPYTDADAEASKTTHISQLKYAENRPDYLRASSGLNFQTLLYSRETTVNFTLNCTNLISGAGYQLIYELLDSDGTTTIIAQEFEATGINQQITGTIPTPPAGHTVTIRRPSIRFTA